MGIVIHEPTRAVILAAGAGSRMRRPDGGAVLEPEQATMADAGMKAMIPIGRPFLDYVLSALADAKCDEACVVVGPEHGAMRDYYERQARPRRIRLAFAVQARPLGTADALLAAEPFVAGEPFLALNADNYYPVDVLAALRRLAQPGLPAFSVESLLADGRIPPERIGAYALLDIGPDGYLRRIVEKPGAAAVSAPAHGTRVSMNLWHFSPEIFRACREVAPSSRGELELPHAVQHAISAHGARFRALPVHAPVLDLSSRADVAAVAAALEGVEVRP